MRVADSYPIVMTDDVAACREFYTRWLGFSVLFEASWIVVLTSSGERPYNLAFMTPDHPSTPPGRETFGGAGLLLTLQVEDAAAEFARLEAAGAPFEHELRDEPWGQRRFMLRDPAGAWVDVVEQIEPAAGFWEQYVTSPSTG
jgi:uncharacterized glyoxalase superfamily protein PhnB